MTDRFPNVARLVAQLPEGSLARALCGCFVGGRDDAQIESALRRVLDEHRESIEKSPKAQATP